MYAIRSYYDGFAIHLNAVALTMMAGSHVIGAQFTGLVNKEIEFYFAVAQHIGVGGAAFLIFIEHVIDHTFAILLAKT